MPDLSALPRPTTEPETRNERPLVLVSLIVGVMILLASLLYHDGDIAGLAKFGGGETVAERTAHVEDVLGREVATVDLLGHDGSMFFLQALDPFYLSPEEHAVHLDRPVYRAQRMLYPVLTSAGGLLPPEAVLWGMGFVNIAALVLGTMAAGRLATRYGGSHWLGLAFLVNPGIIFEMDISGGGVLAFAAALWGTLMLEEGKHRHAIGWFVAAVLAREVMLLYLAGVCVYRLLQTRRIPWLLGGIPALSAAAWAGYIRLRLESPEGVNEVQEFGPPFGGLLDSIEHWFNSPIDLAVSAGIIIVMPLLVVRAWQRPNPLAFGSVGFILLAVLMTRQVWWHFINNTRALAPLITAYVITTFSEPRSPSESPRTRDVVDAPS